MNITPDELLAEAGLMALELRLKNQGISDLEAQVADLEQQVEAGLARIAELEQAAAEPEEPPANAI